MPAKRWIEHDGQRLTLRGWAREADLAPGTLYDRITRQGLPMVRALATGVLDKRQCGMRGKNRSSWA